ncbi:MAG: hypothetical protein U1F81_04335 [Verrucomicrobiaceae bacterium]
MKTTLAFTTALCLAALLTSCASIFNRNQKNVAVSSTPAGLSFEIKDRDGKVLQTGTTPATVRLGTGYRYMKGQTYTFSFRRGGKVVGTSMLETRISGWYWGNFVLGGLPGLLLIDPLTGGMWTMPENVHFGAPASPTLATSRKPGEIRVMSIADVPPHLRSKLVRL